jgi:type IV secretory pathway TrbD component
MQAENRRLSVVHHSLIRPILVLGAERSLAIALWVTVAGLILPWKGWTAAFSAVVLGTAGHAALVYLANLDPQFSQVYVRHFRYRQDCYPARASIWSRPPSPIPAIMVCWIFAVFVSGWLWLLLGHALAVSIICGSPAAYGTWHFATASPIRPTIPSKRSWF